MSAGKLILHPQPLFAPPPGLGSLVNALREVGLVGAEIEAEPGRLRLLAGDRFLQLISFLGCSPYIELEPTAAGGDDYCYLELLGPWASPRLIRGRNTRAPACPDCGRRQNGLQEQVAPWEVLPPTSEWQCAHCGAAHHPGEWNWRQQGGAARMVLLINGIFPSEALPGDELMKRLQAVSADPWRYCYIQDFT